MCTCVSLTYTHACDFSLTAIERSHCITLYQMLLHGKYAWESTAAEK